MSERTLTLSNGRVIHPYLVRGEDVGYQFYFASWETGDEGEMRYGTTNATAVADTDAGSAYMLKIVSDGSTNEYAGFSFWDWSTNTWILKEDYLPRRMWVGYWFKPVTLPASGEEFLTQFKGYDSGATGQLYGALTITSGGAIKIRDMNNDVVGTSTITLSAGTVYHIEIYWNPRSGGAYLGPEYGRVTVYVNGEFAVQGTGIYSEIGDYGMAQKVFLCGTTKYQAVAWEFRFDDFYMSDKAERWGPSRAEVLVNNAAPPTGDILNVAGAYTDIDDIPPNDSDSLYTTNSGDWDDCYWLAAKQGMTTTHGLLATNRIHCVKFMTRIFSTGYVVGEHQDEIAIQFAIEDPEDPDEELYVRFTPNNLTTNVAKWDQRWLSYWPFSSAELTVETLDARLKRSGFLAIPVYQSEGHVLRVSAHSLIVFYPVVPPEIKIDTPPYEAAFDPVG